MDETALWAAARHHDNWAGDGTIGALNARRNAEQIVDAYLKAAGLVAVPEEPSDEMLVAAEEAAPCLATFADKHESPSYLAYRAMIAAAKKENGDG